MNDNVKTIIPPPQITYQATTIRELEEAYVHIRDLFLPPAAIAPAEDDFGTDLRILQSFPEFLDENANNQHFTGRYVVTPLSMLAMRMKWGMYSKNYDYGSAKVPFQHISVHAGNEKVFVFVVVSGKSVTIEDDPKLFPSDTLITQLTMLEASSVDRA